MPLLQPLREALRPEYAIRIPSQLTYPRFPIALRPLTLADEDEWLNMRSRNAEWLAEWESGSPIHEQAPSFAQWIRSQRTREQRGEGAIFGITWQDRLVGQISLGAINYGAMRTGTIGYWVDKAYAGHGFAPMAMCLLADWVFLDPQGPKLHRLEIAIRPENERSLNAVRKINARDEGLRRAYMYVDGQWRDHEVFVMQAEDVSFAEHLATSLTKTGSA